MDGLRRFGWQEVTRLTSGGVVEHSTNWYHGELGQVDVHLRFPGIQIESDRAFEYMWQDRRTQRVARSECTVRGLEVQRLILLLHAARSSRTNDVQFAWQEVTHAERNGVLALGHADKLALVMACLVR